MRYWVNTESGSDKLIVISDTIIYNSSPSEMKLEQFQRELKTGQIPKELTGTPFSYLRYIEASSKNPTLKIHYGKENNLELIVKNEKHKREILDYLKNDAVNRPGYTKEQLSWFNAAKKPLLVLVIAGLIIFYMATIAADIQNGAEYEVRGGGMKGGGVGLLLLGLAEVLGFTGIVLVGIVISGLLTYQVVRQIKNPPVVETFDYLKKRI